MADRIKYGILPNPQPDAEGKTTYQVRHMPDGTMSEKGFLAHLEYHNTYNTIMMQSSLSVLKKEIIEQLRDNKRFRIDGIGTFQMKVGLIPQYDVEVQGVSFTPDPSFVKALRRKTSTRNKFGRGPAGRNKPYTREQVVKFLDNYLNAQHSITRKQLQYGLNITEYRAQKWLDELMAEPGPKYYCKQQGKTSVYYRHADNAV